MWASRDSLGKFDWEVSYTSSISNLSNFSDDESIDVLNITPEKEREMIEADVDENGYVPLEEVPPPIPATVFHRRPLTQVSQLFEMFFV